MSLSPKPDPERWICFYVQVLILLCLAGFSFHVSRLLSQDRDNARRLIEEHIEPMKAQIMRLDGQPGETWRPDK